MLNICCRELMNFISNKIKALNFIIIIFVIAIVSVVLAIMIPIKDHGPGRSKVITVMYKMNHLVEMLERYYSENNSYFPTRPLKEVCKNPKKLREAGGWQLLTLDTRGIQIARLTTPISYLETNIDLFSPQGELPFAYYTVGDGFILISAGPDGDYDINPYYDFVTTFPKVKEKLVNLAYDPTNGTYSNGDVFYVYIYSGVFFPSSNVGRF
jgi:Tfp pilus assembly protein PilE